MVGSLQIFPTNVSTINRQLAEADAAVSKQLFPSQTKEWMILTLSSTVSLTSSHCITRGTSWVMEKLLPFFYYNTILNGGQQQLHSPVFVSNTASNKKVCEASASSVFL